MDNSPDYLGQPSFDPVRLRSDYERDGYAVVRGLFSPGEVAALAEDFDRVLAHGLARGRSWRHGNLLYRLGEDPQLGRILRMVQWPAREAPALAGRLAALRLDRRFVSVLTPLIGGDLKQIINQMHWKPPNAVKAEFAYHQDSRFRRPASAYRDLAGSYVQTGLAIDPHTKESGAMRVIPGSHKKGELGLGGDGPILHQAMQDEALKAAGLDVGQVVDLLLEPGDLALWSPYLVHGSGANVSARDRRLYINGYVTAQNCDRGEWAFRNSEPVPLGPEPVLVSFEGLHDKPEPHFLED